MTLPFMAAAMTLAEIAPLISKWFTKCNDSSETTQKIAHHVVDLAKKVTKTDDTDAALNILQQEPKILLQYQHLLLSLDYQIEGEYFKDRLNARHRDMAFINAGRSNTRADVMVVSAALGLIFCLFSLGYYQLELPGEAVGIISTIAGIFGSCLKDAYAFEFGSSRGSKTKDLTTLLAVQK